MGSYLAVPHKKRSDGSRSWRVEYRYYEGKKRLTRIVPPAEYPDRGLSREMTLEAAKERLASINASNRLNRNEKNIALRLAEDRDKSLAYLPQSVVSEFEAELNRRFSRRASAFPRSGGTQSWDDCWYADPEDFGKLVWCFSVQ